VQKLVLLSAGGTGGHVFPAAALARELVARGFRVEIVTDSRGKKYANHFDGIPVHVIHSGTAGGGIAGKLNGVARLSIGMVQALRLVGRLKPAVVVGFGGYPSFPAVYAAQAKKIPTVLHEQNAVIGRANALLARKAERIALSLPSPKTLAGVDPARCVLTGNPVRADIVALRDKPYPAFTDKLNVFVMGGSLGATVFSEVVPAALAQLPPEQRARLNVTQQCRAADINAARAAYEAAGIIARLEPFIDDVPAVLERSHLIISRSGASTVAEVAVAGRPAIFVPYPFHKDHQQKVNAESVANAGGAWVMEQPAFTPEVLTPRIAEFLQNPETLSRAAAAAHKCGRPDAARDLANLVVSVGFPK
jgi:UDP-N-acetylglucosamine--N-acetylmuramyl-(pentapeptide) pyrophosphoryl-undecaprenol N-acetylglucosamine transferase